MKIMGIRRTTKASFTSITYSKDSRMSYFKHLRENLAAIGDHFLGVAGLEPIFRTQCSSSVRKRVSKL